MPSIETMMYDYFYSDLKAEDLSIYPVVIIGDNIDEFICISTNSVSLVSIDVENIGSSYYFQGIMKDIPGITESINLETGRYKISNVDIQVSNFEMNEKPFMENFANSLYLNQRVQIFWCSQSTRRISALDNIDPETVDVNKVKELAFPVYQGILLRIKKDKDRVTLVVEDKSMEFLEKNIPTSYNLNTETVPEQVRNKVIPAQYGFIDKAPVIVSEGTVDEEGVNWISEIITDAKPNAAFIDYFQMWNIGAVLFPMSALWISANTLYLNINRYFRWDTDYGIPDEVSANFVYLTEPSGVQKIQFPIDEILENDTSKGILTSSYYRPFKNINAFASGQGINIGVNYQIQDIDGNWGNVNSWEGTNENIPWETTFDNNLSTRIRIAGEQSDWGNAYYRLQINLDDVPFDFPCETYFIGKITNVAEAPLIAYSGVSPVLLNADPTENINNFEYGEYLPTKYGVAGFESTGQQASFSLGIPAFDSTSFLGINWWNDSMDVDVSLTEAHLWQLVHIKNIFGQDFYADIAGRVSPEYVGIGDPNLIDLVEYHDLEDHIITSEDERSIHHGIITHVAHSTERSDYISQSCVEHQWIQIKSEASPTTPPGQLLVRLESDERIEWGVYCAAGCPSGNMFEVECPPGNDCGPAGWTTDANGAWGYCDGGGGSCWECLEIDPCCITWTVWKHIIRTKTTNKQWEEMMTSAYGPEYVDNVLTLEHFLAFLETFEEGGINQNEEVDWGLYDGPSTFIHPAVPLTCGKLGIVPVTDMTYDYDNDGNTVGYPYADFPNGHCSYLEDISNLNSGYYNTFDNGGGNYTDWGMWTPGSGAVAIDHGIFIQHVSYYLASCAGEGEWKSKFYMGSACRLAHPMEFLGLIERPSDIIYSLIDGELLGEWDTEPYIKTDKKSLNISRIEHFNWYYAHTIHSKIKFSKYVKELVSESKSIPYFKGDQLNFITIQSRYGDYSVDHLIRALDVISYKAKQTKLENVHNRINIRFELDYSTNEYLNNLGEQYGTDEGWMNEGLAYFPYDRGFYGINDDNQKAYVLNIDSKLIRDENTAKNLARYKFFYHCNVHLVMEVTLPISYINIYLGDIISFDGLIDKKVFNIDYSVLDIVNGQQVYPYFLVNKVKKTLKNVTITCEQLHNLSNEEVTSSGSQLGNYRPELLQIKSGCTNKDAPNYDSTVQYDDGSCLSVRSKSYASYSLKVNISKNIKINTPFSIFVKVKSKNYGYTNKGEYTVVLYREGKSKDIWTIVEHSKHTSLSENISFTPTKIGTYKVSIFGLFDFTMSGGNKDIQINGESRAFEVTQIPELLISEEVDLNNKINLTKYYNTGDINLDNKVDSADFGKLISYISGNKELNHINILGGDDKDIISIFDLNQDGAVDILDVFKMSKKVLKK